METGSRSRIMIPQGFAHSSFPWRWVVGVLTGLCPKRRVVSLRAASNLRGGGHDPPWSTEPLCWTREVWLPQSCLLSLVNSFHYFSILHFSSRARPHAARALDFRTTSVAVRHRTESHRLVPRIGKERTRMCVMRESVVCHGWTGASWQGSSHWSPYCCFLF